MSLPTSISGFTVVPVSYSSSSTHYIYVRSHAGSKKAAQNDLPEGRTLFMVNVPPDSTDRELAQLFKRCGTVEKVIFDLDTVEPHHEDSDSDEEMEDTPDPTTAEPGADEQPRKRRKVAKDDTPKVVPLPFKSLRTLRLSGRSAHLVFLDRSSLERALSSATKPRPWPSIPEEPVGLAHYTALYDSLRPPLDAVREHADSSILVYEHELQKTKQKSKYRKGEAIVDEDGFTLVTRGGAYGQTLGGGVGVASKRFQRSGETSKRSRGNKKEEKEKTNFYAFQKAEKQRSELMNLKKRWEEDKAKVEALKASRKFRPY
ncbi:putative ribosomal RNA-processing protein 7 (RRP7) [Lyophyllum shimeji]|uniref:Ribosomal RNA-processing protein 7 (RRP7) n=1 Tax=Lyophyllum shimeji TaxID=47721 RepID=A0A9P3UKD6_LYOSH|nr:putative ribosomal RNA-processing protein 7 (RRP7) [Lyophyllum shimeji]